MTFMPGKSKKITCMIVHTGKLFFIFEGLKISHIKYNIRFYKLMKTYDNMENVVEIDFPGFQFW